RRHIARRAAELPDSIGALALVVDRLASVTDARVPADLLQGALRGLEGLRTAPRPAGWAAAFARLSGSGDAEPRVLSLELAVVFDVPVALDLLRSQAVDRSLPAERRCQAIDALVGRRPPELAPVLLELVGERHVALAAIRGLAHYHHPE